MKTLLKIVGAFGLIVFVLLPAGCLGRLSYENRYHASEYFADIPYEKALASRRWHPIGLPTWGCSYAIVEILEDSPKIPPDAWKLDWQPTPAARLGDTTRDAVGSCRENWSREVHTRIETALSEAGSYYWRDGVGESVHIYAPSQRIAAHVRYGD